MKKPKIAIIHCSFIYRGGGERIVMEEVLGLRKGGYEVECFAPVLDKEKCYPDLIEEIQVKTFLPQLPSFFPLRYALVMVLTSLLIPFFVFRLKKFDLLIGANQPGAWLAFVCAKMLKKPYLVYLNHPNRILYPRADENWHSVVDFYVLDKILKLFRPLIAFLDRLSIASADSVLTNGFFIRQEIEQTYSIKTIPCPSGTRILQENIPSKKIDSPAPFLLFIGRHEAWKKIEWAIEAFAQIKDEFPSLLLIIPGPSTPYTAKLKEMVAKLKLSHQVLFPGTINQKQLEQLYRRATVFVFPSPKEDFGIVVLEAMSAGTPVVAWNKGGPTDSVIDGETGFLAKPYEITDFAQKIALLLRDPALRFKMGERAIEHVKKNFSWEKHCAILEKEIKKALTKTD